MLQTFLKKSGDHRNLGTWSRMVHSLIPQRGTKHALLRCSTVQNTPPQLAEVPGSWASNTGSTFWPSLFESQRLQEEHSKKRGCPHDQSSPSSLPGTVRLHKQGSSEQCSWEQVPEHCSPTGTSGWSPWQMLIQSKAHLPLTKSYQERPEPLAGPGTSTPWSRCARNPQSTVFAHELQITAFCKNKGLTSL